MNDPQEAPEVIMTTGELSALLRIASRLRELRDGSNSLPVREGTEAARAALSELLMQHTHAVKARRQAANRKIAGTRRKRRTGGEK